MSSDATRGQLLAALKQLMAAYAKLADETCKQAERNEAYSQAKALISP